MQSIVFETPYRFVPPHRGRLWPDFLQLLLEGYNRRTYGVVKTTCLGTEGLRDSIKAGHGIMLTPNHSRPADPMLLGMLTKHTGQHLYTMASWHLFKQTRFMAAMIRRMGGFSIYREGPDRAALNAAVELLVEAKRALVIFPEGVTTRTNDRLAPLLEGPSFIARTAAKRRAKASPSGQVVIHPVAIKYYFMGEDFEASISPVLHDLETRLTWQPHVEASLLDRVQRISEALLTLKEIEFFGQPQSGAVAERQDGLLRRLLEPLEIEWLGSAQDGYIVPRVKRLRTAILPEMITGKITAEERARRWRHLAMVYLAQQVAAFPQGYLADCPTDERLLETVERLEEDVTDVARVHPPLHATIWVGPAILVQGERRRGNGDDPLMLEVGDWLQRALDELARPENHPRQGGTPRDVLPKTLSPHPAENEAVPST